MNQYFHNHELYLETEKGVSMTSTFLFLEYENSAVIISYIIIDYKKHPS